MEGFVRNFDEQILRIEFEALSNRRNLSGIEAVTAHVAQGRSTWAEGSCRPVRFVTADDKVVVTCHIRVRLKGQTEWLEGSTGDVFTFRDGKVIEFRTFADEHEALDYAGAR